MNIYCHGERTTMRIWHHYWTCDRCGKRLWKADMARKKAIPIEEVSYGQVYMGSGGFRYTLRGKDMRVIYDSPRAFNSRYDARKEIEKRWPRVPVSFEV